MVRFEINTDHLILGMDSLRDALVGSGQDASNLVRDETKRLARTITAFIPPMGSSARKVGESAVERDIKNLVSEASDSVIDEIGSRYGIADIRSAFITAKDGSKINLQWAHLDPTGNRLAEYHAKYKDRKGRIPKVKPQRGIWAARVVVPFGVRSDYIKKVQKHVGSWKASWAKVGAKLGDKYPSWLSRHFGNPFGIVDDGGLRNQQAPSIVFGSSSPGNGRMRQQISAAVASRTRTIARRVKLILSGYNKDLAAGMKAKARAKEWSEPQPNVT